MKTAREVLDVIDLFLLDSDSSIDFEEKLKLWDILTALRGPDFSTPNFDLKLKGTNHVRRGAFPKYFEAVGKNQAPWLGASSYTETRLTEREIELYIVRNENLHFITHLHSAFEALGL